MQLKKFTQKDRYGNMNSFEFNIPPMNEVPQPDHPGGPKGTDTVPAWLTPGENVVNAEASRLYQPMIDKMNNKGRAIQAQQGGPVPSYEASGGIIGETEANYGGKNTYSDYFGKPYQVNKLYQPINDSLISNEVTKMKEMGLPNNQMMSALEDNLNLNSNQALTAMQPNLGASSIGSTPNTASTTQTPLYNAAGTPPKNDIVQNFMDQSSRNHDSAYLAKKPNYLAGGSISRELADADEENMRKYMEQAKYNQSFVGGRHLAEGGRMPAASIDGNEFAKAAQSVGLPTDNATLNKIVNLVNQGLSVQDAAKTVAGIPQYKAEGGVIIDDNILDGMMQVESGGDVNAVSEAGAIGPMQIMPSTAQNPGYGVKPISLEDLKDPTLSRDFARRYMQKLADRNPQLNVDEIKTAYHSGLGNVLKSRSGEEALGPRGQAYAGKVNAAMGEEPPVQMASMSDTDGYNFYPKNPTGTYPDVSGIVPESDTGGFFDSIRRIPEATSDFFGGIKDKLDSQEKSEDKFDEFYAARNELENINQDINLANEQLKTADDNKKIRLNEKLKELNKRKAELNIEVPRLGSEYKKLPKGEGYFGFDTPVIGSDNTIDVDKDTESVDLKPNKDKTDIAKKVIQDTNTADYDEGKSELDKADDEWAKKNLTGEYEGDFAQNLINKAKEYGGVVVDKSMEYFKNAFSSMFDGEELARMAMIYAGSRAMGYNHGGSLNYSMKNYVKRVEANASAAKSFSLTDKAREDYTEDSLKQYSKTGDRDTLIPKGKTIGLQSVSGNLYVPGYGKMTTYKTKGGAEYVQVDGKTIPVPSIKGAEKWDDKVHGDATVAKRYDTFGKQTVDAINQEAGLKAGDDGFVSYKPLGSQANTIYRKILRQNGVNINDAPDMQMAVERAMDKFLQAKADYNSKKISIQPNNLEAFVNAEVFTSLTGIKQAFISGTSPLNLEKVDKMIKRDMENKSVRSDAYKEEYYNDWQGTMDAYKRVPDIERRQLIKEAAEKTEGGNKWSAFTLWVSRTSPEEIEKLLKQ